MSVFPLGYRVKKNFTYVFYADIILNVHVYKLDLKLINIGLFYFFTHDNLNLWITFISFQ